MAFSLGEYQDIFLEEADEQLQELNQNLLELEKNPENLEIINNIESTVENDGVQRYRTNVQSQEEVFAFRIEQGVFFSHVRSYFIL